MVVDLLLVRLLAHIMPGVFCTTWYGGHVSNPFISLAFLGIVLPIVSATVIDRPGTRP